MDTLLRNARILGRDYTATFDVGIEAGRIAAIEPAEVMPVQGAARVIDLDGRLVAPAFVETHI
ncbi:MAG: amidohydrolase, partial [Rhodocyclaceae bacterium]|nr:amidohydrolase [Rhodocyclaceae bacterium]